MYSYGPGILHLLGQERLSIVERVTYAEEKKGLF